MQFDATSYLTLREAAAEIGVTPETLSRWIRAGSIPAIRLPSGHYRIHRGDLALVFRPGPTARADRRRGER